MRIIELIEQTVSALGYELVDVEYSGRKMLVVYIDHEMGIKIDDCEKVTRQLQHVLLVEDFDYDRLEVSSPGLDRPLKKINDFVRFVGAEVSVTLNHAVDGRKHFKGVLLPMQDEFIILEFEDKQGSATISFTIADVDKARLIPQVDFRSRKS